MQSSPDEPLVQLLVRADCSLCGPAREIVQRVCESLGAPWSVTDISEPGMDEFAAKWTDMIPVVLVAGVPQGFWTIDDERLTHAVRAELGGSGTRRLRA